MCRKQCAICASTSLFLSCDYFSVVLIPWTSSPQNHTNTIKEEREKMKKGRGVNCNPRWQLPLWMWDQDPSRPLFIVFPRGEGRWFSSCLLEEARALPSCQRSVLPVCFAKKHLGLQSKYSLDEIWRICITRLLHQPNACSVPDSSQHRFFRDWSPHNKQFYGQYNRESLYADKSLQFSHSVCTS